MATEDNEVEDHRPLVLIHHLPSFKLPLQDRLITHFRLFDSLASPDASSVRALICVGTTPVTADTLDHLPSLRLVVGSSAGLDHLDLAKCHRRDIAVTNSGDANSENVADYAVALFLDVLRRVSATNRFVCSGLWPQMGEYPLGFKVAGILVVGLVYGFRSWPWVSDRVSSYGFLVGVGRGFDCVVSGLRFEKWV